MVGGVLVVAALLDRYAWKPVPWEKALLHAQDPWGLPVSGVDKWFSAWAVRDGQEFAMVAADSLGLNEGWGLGYPPIDI